MHPYPDSFQMSLDSTFKAFKKLEKHPDRHLYLDPIKGLTARHKPSRISLSTEIASHVYQLADTIFQTFDINSKCIQEIHKLYKHYQKFTKKSKDPPSEAQETLSAFLDLRRRTAIAYHTYKGFDHWMTLCNLGIETEEIIKGLFKNTLISLRSSDIDPRIQEFKACLAKSFKNQCDINRLFRLSVVTPEGFINLYLSSQIRDIHLKVYFSEDDQIIDPSPPHHQRVTFSDLSQVHFIESRESSSDSE